MSNRPTESPAPTLVRESAPASPPAPAVVRTDASSIVVGLRDAVRRRERIKRIVLAAVAGLAVLFMLGALVFKRRVKVEERWAVPERRAMRSTLRELGTVAARNETFVFSLFTGEVVWKIEEGKFVEAGTVIVRFDAKDAQDDLEKMTKDLFDKEEAVSKVEKDLECTRAHYELEIAQKQALLEEAKIDRDLAFGHPTAREKRDSELALESSQLKFDQAEKDYLANKDLEERGFVTEAVLKQKALNMATQKADLAKAKILHTLALQGSSADAKRIADLAVGDAQKNLATSIFNRDADLAIKNAELELNRIELQNFKQSIELKKRDLESAEVKAPVAGRVAFVDVFKGGGKAMSPIQIGEMRNRGQDLCKVVDTSTLRVRTWINEADIAKVAVGQSAEVRIAAFPERAFKASVSDIALVAQDKNVANSRLALLRSGEAFVNVVSVALDFTDLSEQDRVAMRLGFTADVSVDCTPQGAGNSALVVPWSTVHFGANGEHWVLAAEGGGAPERRDVTLGRGDTGFVEVLKGLNGNERLLDPAKPASEPAPTAGEARTP
ncbi:MAG: HlyD family efflux transporter periplasmic adaptor subunit [Planctomycetes bacterium]|nr:HlyD family efflux transporter periplasmic adaptor subunit [Planctomycetota bacterium]